LLLNDTFFCPLADAGPSGKGVVMPASPEARLRLPAHPSQDHLQARQAAAKSEKLKLAAAQRRLAADYGLATWAALMCGVDQGRTHDELPPLSAAAARADVAAVRELLAGGVQADGERGEAQESRQT
jgi:hypothetical protein